MAQSVLSEPRAAGVPRFYVTPRQRFPWWSVLLAVVLALGGLVGAGFALRHSRNGRALTQAFGWRAGATANDDDDEDDDPSRVDTIYLGGPDQAPVGTRPGAKERAVHPFVVVKLPRDGAGTGQIPDTPAGRLLYGWLAAFNGTEPSALARALPTQEVGATEAAQVELRRETGGFTLLSAKEVEPGLLVFRLHDQTAAENEVLGTLQMRAGPGPAAVASFSLRAVPAVRPPGSAAAGAAAPPGEAKTP